jgi:hypothetical protein
MVITKATSSGDILMLKRCVLLLLVASFGCSGNSPPSGPPLATAHPVQGRIVFSDQSPLRGGVIFFTPVDIEVEDGRIRYEAASLVDANGRYKLGFNGDRSGAPAGECKVTIQPRDYQELPQSNSKRIPARYREASKTPLAVTVKEMNNVFNFELK